MHSLRMAPPIQLLRSSTHTFQPALASRAAPVRELIPLPTNTASKLSMVSETRDLAIELHEFELISPRIEEINNTHTRTLAFGHYDRSIHNANLIFRLQVGDRLIEIGDAQGDMVAPDVTVSRWILAAICGAVVLKQLQHQVGTELEHDKAKPRPSYIHVGVTPVAPVGSCGEFHGIERPHAKALHAAEDVGIESDRCINIRHRDPNVIDSQKLGNDTVFMPLLVQVEVTFGKEGSVPRQADPIHYGYSK